MTAINGRTKRARPMRLGAPIQHLDPLVRIGEAFGALPPGRRMATLRELLWAADEMAELTLAELVMPGRSVSEARETISIVRAVAHHLLTCAQDYEDRLDACSARRVV